MNVQSNISATQSAPAEQRLVSETARSLKLQGLNKHYGPFHAVKDLSLEIEPGEFLVLLGPSGCGKSTALRMIAGLEDITSGAMVIGDNDVTHVLPKYRDIAMVFQSYALYPHKTVAENIGFPLKVAGASPAERDAAVKDAASQVQMEDYLHRYPKELSGGQRQRVALARAIVRRPAIFLMDEPLSNLDAKLRSFMRAELKHMQQTLGVTTVYVTHDQIEAMTLAHRVAIMRDGVLQQLGTPTEVYDNPANKFVAGFMGSPPMNFIKGSLSGGTFTSAYGQVSLAGYADHDNVSVGFRAEETSIAGPDKGHFSGIVFSCEMTGHETIVTCEMDDGHAIVRAAKDYSIPMGAEIHLTVDPARVCVFDESSGVRIRPETA
ncbi:MAG: ABC transporter ATP-binding protein [Pseudomonadota bacterium]